MRRFSNTLLTVSFVSTVLFAPSCQIQPNNKAPEKPVAQTSPAQTSPKPSPTQQAKTSQITLPLLDALLAQPTFVSELKTKLQITDDQVETLRRVASSEVQRLRQRNAERSDDATEDARAIAFERVSEVIGDDKAKQLATLADDYSARGDDDSTASDIASTGPNAIPTDTRVVVNIPAFRMDLFKDGTLVKTYKIGIGYPEFPLPEGTRKAQSVIFNPTWTPPDSPWVATMKDVTPGERVEAGSSLNPLGPIKIPIGMPSLIHGGKSVAKIGKFASHGCVGLTNAQVKDFAKLLLEASGTEVSDRAIAGFLANNTQTHVVKLNKTVPVELRYETIVVEDGKLHIYKDVYDKKTNTEENLRKVLENAGVSFDSLSEEEKANTLSALSAMSAHPKVTVDTSAKTSAEKTGIKKIDKKVKNSGEQIVEIASMTSKGYPAPVDLDKGTGTAASVRTNHVQR